MKSRSSKKQLQQLITEFSMKCKFAASFIISKRKNVLTFKIKIGIFDVYVCITFCQNSTSLLHFFWNSSFFPFFLSFSPARSLFGFHGKWAWTTFSWNSLSFDPTRTLSLVRNNVPQRIIQTHKCMLVSVSVCRLIFPLFFVHSFRTFCFQCWIGVLVFHGK